MPTKIEWCQVPGYKPEVWNPVTGCTRVSPGCDNCYAIRQSHRFSGIRGSKFEGVTTFREIPPDDENHVDWSGLVRCHEDLLDLPLRWKQPRAIFVNSMSDLFHDDVPNEFIAQVFAVMSLSLSPTDYGPEPGHRFMILTKRPLRMKAWFKWIEDQWPKIFYGRVDPEIPVDSNIALQFLKGSPLINDRLSEVEDTFAPLWPLPNVWLGVSVENQAMADQRIPHLLKTPAAVRFVSVEPMLGPVDLTRWLRRSVSSIDYAQRVGHGNQGAADRLDWVICGGESGPRARPMHPDWARSLRDQCRAADVPFFFKQWGEYFVNPCNDWKDKNVTKVYDPVTDTHHVMFRAKRDNKIAYGSTALLDGEEYHEWPEVR